MSILFVFGLFTHPWAQVAYSVHSSTVMTDEQCEEQIVFTRQTLRRQDWDTLIIECRKLQ